MENAFFFVKMFLEASKAAQSSQTLLVLSFRVPIGGYMSKPWSGLPAPVKLTVGRSHNKATEKNS